MHCPRPVILVRVDVEVTQAWLFIRSSVHLLPSNWIAGRIKMHPYEPNLVHVGVDSTRAVVLFVEVWQFVEFRSFGYWTTSRNGSEPVAIAMASASRSNADKQIRD